MPGVDKGDLLVPSHSQLFALFDGLLVNNQIPAGLWGFPNGINAGYNPSIALNPNRSTWAVIDFHVETTRGVGNRVWARSLQLLNPGDPPEIVFRRAGPDNAGAYGPNGDGTGLEQTIEGSGLGFITWQGMIKQLAFQGHSGRFGCRLMEDCRQYNTIATVQSNVAIGATEVEVDDLDTPTVTDGDEGSFHQSGKVEITGGGGAHFFHSGRTSNKLLGCEGIDAPIFAGTNVFQRHNHAGGTIHLSTSDFGTANTARRFSVDPDGAFIFGELGIATGSRNFFTVRGGSGAYREIGPPSSLVGSVVGPAGTASYTYAVVGRASDGSSTAPTSITINNAPNILTDTNYIKLTWAGPRYGIKYWDIIRTASTGTPSTTGPVALNYWTLSETGRKAFVDDGKALATVNEKQSVYVVDAVSGTFSLTFDGQTTAQIVYTEPLDPVAIQTALTDLSNIGVGDVEVTSSSINGVVVEFKGALAGTNVAQLTGNPSGLVGAVAEDLTPLNPFLDIRTREPGGPATYTLPLRDFTGDWTVDGVVTGKQGFNANLAKITNVNGGTQAQEAVNRSQLDTKQDLSAKGQVNGYASLDSGGAVPISQLPAGSQTYKGTWNATTNTPTLLNTGGVTKATGDMYRISTGGSHDFGAGAISFDVGDAVLFSGAIWEKLDLTDAVVSVNGETGAVSLDATDVGAIATGATVSGVLSGSLTSPGFAEDMATQAELDTGLNRILRTWDRPTAALGETFPRAIVDSNSLVTETSGVLMMVPIYLLNGTTVTNITFFKGSTAIASATNQWFALYDKSRNLLRQTVDDGATAWASNTAKTLALTSAYNITSSDVYLLGVMVAATTPGNWIGSNGLAVINDLAPAYSGNSTSGLTTTAPNPAGGITGRASGSKYAYVS